MGSPSCRFASACEWGSLPSHHLQFAAWQTCPNPFTNHAENGKLLPGRSQTSLWLHASNPGTPLLIRTSSPGGPALPIPPLLERRSGSPVSFAPLPSHRPARIGDPSHPPRIGPAPRSSRAVPRRLHLPPQLTKHAGLRPRVCFSQPVTSLFLEMGFYQQFGWFLALHNCPDNRAHHDRGDNVGDYATRLHNNWGRE